MGYKDEDELEKKITWSVARKVSPKQAPKWFCGNAEEWRLVRDEMLASGWSATRIMGTEMYDLRSKPGSPFSRGRWNGTSGNAPIAGTITKAVGAASAISAFLLMSNLVAHSPSGFTGEKIALMGVLTLGVGAVGLFVGMMAGGMGSVLGLNAIAGVAERIKGNTAERRTSMAETLGEERLGQMVAATDLAFDEMCKVPELMEESLLAERVLSATRNLRKSIKKKKDRMTLPERTEASLESVAEKIRKELPEAFAKKEREADSRNLSEATLEGRLLRLGELGADGTAALALWKGMKNLSKEEESERARQTDERIPRLLSAFESVPREERSVPCAALNGETPEGSLRRGLAAALETALSTRAAATERGKIATEAEARVLEAARLKV